MIKTHPLKMNAFMHVKMLKIKVSHYKHDLALRAPGG